MTIQGLGNEKGAQRLRMNRLTAFVGVSLVIVLMMSGCRTTPTYTIPSTTVRGACLTPTRDENLLIGLAVSGGGSRAALYAAGAFDALARVQVGSENRSLLEQVSYISSVSGGSLASAYYVLKKPTHETPVLTPSGELSEPYQQFFEEFRDSMAQDFEGPLLRRNLFRWRWFNPAWAAASLQEILSEEENLGGMRFGELANREMQGDSPRLLVNTTLYNDGRRMVVSTLPREEGRYDLMADVSRASGEWRPRTETTRVLQAKWDTLQSTSLEDLKLDACDVNVASAVVASMSFPPLIGPITLRVGDEDRYWHIGDGGMSDNTGGESLLMVMLKKLKEGTARRALLLSIDSSFPFDVGGEELNHRNEGFSLLSYDFSRIPSIQEERSLAYRSLFLQIGQMQGIFPDARTITGIRLRHTDAQWKDDLSDLPDSCRKEEVNWKSPRDISRHLAHIVTRLFIESKCDRDLVWTAAHKVVAQNEEAIKTFLRSEPTDRPPPRGPTAHP